MVSSLPPHRASTIRWFGDVMIEGLVPALEPTSRSLPPAADTMSSGRALCTHAAPYTLHTGCGLALAQPLRVVDGQSHQANRWPDRRERGKRTLTHRRFRETSGHNRGDPPPILDRRVPHPAAPCDRGPRKYRSQFFGRLHESIILLKACFSTPAR